MTQPGKFEYKVILLPSEVGAANRLFDELTQAGWQLVKYKSNQCHEDKLVMRRSYRASRPATLDSNGIQQSS